MYFHNIKRIHFIMFYSINISFQALFFPYVWMHSIFRGDVKGGGGLGYLSRTNYLFLPNLATRSAHGSVHTNPCLVYSPGGVISTVDLVIFTCFNFREV